ncbi:MAG: putative MFS family arabinose efflux permease [Parasphingorhabdus sp.]|jgi:predicted MFS family arabinose efflux permease
MRSSSLNSAERRAVVSLAGIFALRMLGLFLVLPVFAVFARDLPGSTPFLAGLALGIYGLTQSVLQIPFGYLSDRYGRKEIITCGLLIFIIGSVVAALSDSIYGIIFGRALQGAGAIAAAILALAADLTREQQRTKAMASIGVSIGGAFMLALMLGPLLEAWFGVSGIFWVTAILAVLALPVLWWYTPTPATASIHVDLKFQPGRFVELLWNPQLIRFDIGIFALHLALTAIFVVVPLTLVDALGLNTIEHWKIYIPVMLASVVGMLPLIILAHKFGNYSAAMKIAIGLLIVAELMFAFVDSQLIWIVVALWLFFSGFNALEALLPTLVSRLAPAGSKGTVMGVYNTFQFVGIFVGGALGGWLFGQYGAAAVFLLATAALGLWLILIITAPALRLLDSLTLHIDPQFDGDPRDLYTSVLDLPGIEDATVLIKERLVYIKVDKQVFQPDSLVATQSLKLEID